MACRARYCCCAGLWGCAAAFSSSISLTSPSTSSSASKGARCEGSWAVTCLWALQDWQQTKWESKRQGAMSACRLNAGLPVRKRSPASFSTTATSMFLLLPSTTCGERGRGQQGQCGWRAGGHKRGYPHACCPAGPAQAAQHSVPTSVSARSASFSVSRPLVSAWFFSRYSLRGGDGGVGLTVAVPTSARTQRLGQH